MPTILKSKKKNNPRPHGKNLEIKKNIYHTKTWRELRLSKLQENPVCEICGNALATQVHHKVEISKGKDIDEMKELGFDYNNLLSICEECHISIHKKTKKV